MKRNAWPVALAIVMALVASSGCRQQVQPGASPQPSGDLSAVLEVIPNPPLPMEKSVLQLTLRDAEQRPVVGAAVQFDLTMPGMTMPPNHPQATAAGDGIYRSDVLFTMAGHWQIMADVTLPGQNQQFTFLLDTQ
jgi:hypothetical protein